MTSHIKTKHKTFLFGIVAICFIVVAVILNLNYNKSLKDYSSFSKKTQEVLQKKENQLQEYLKTALQKTKNSKEKISITNDDYSNLTEKGLTVLIYSNDTLCYWSDNNVTCDLIYNPDAFDSVFTKLTNGWYRIIKTEERGLRIIGLILVKNEYRYENDYLKNEFNADFCLPQRTQIQTTPGEHQIFSSDGKYLFSLEFSKKNQLREKQTIQLFILYLIGLLFFIAALFYFHKRLYLYYKSNLIFVPAFILDIIIIRLLIFHFKIPESLYQSEIFSPLLFASSDLLPSFGDLLVNTLLFVICAGVFNKWFYYKPDYNKKIASSIRLGISAIIIFLTGCGLYYLVSLMNRIVLDSVIPYTLNNIFNLTNYSIIGFLVIASLLLGFTLISIRIYNILFRISERKYGFLISLSCGLILLLIFNTFVLKNWFIYSAFCIYSICIWLLREKPDKTRIFSRSIFALIFFSLLTTYILHQSNVFKENEKRKSLAQKLSASQDPVAEYLYKDNESNILSDKELKNLFSSYPQEEQKIKDYIKEKYFRGYWDKYQIQITLCSQNDSLFIRPEMINQSCNDYFNELIKKYGQSTQCGNLYMLNYGTGGNSYISTISFATDSANRITAYTELYSKFIPKGLGYPELLIDKKIFLNTDLSNYSYARYRNNQLVDAYGKYYYNILQDPLDTIAQEIGFYERNNYSHLYYKINENSELIISRKKPEFIEIIAPFSLLFLFYSVYLLIFYIVISLPFKTKQLKLTFKNRLQISMISMILISFVLIGISMLYYIRNLNENKNMDNLSEKTLSILIEVQAKLSQYDSLTPEIKNYAANWLVKFSNVFFSDINLFDLRGNLIASSRPQVFNEGLISERMDPIAYNELVFNKKTLYIHKEKIGNLDYYSAYIPFYNNNNRLTAYLNLPYFARENELKQELSTFMMTFINIYVLLIAITVIIALLVAGRMTRPLKEIRDKIGKVKLGGRNEKIEWNRSMDEIGDLVTEYNRMIDELALSAELLAKSERESAWREMAKQVAHEIKNPLTPMKLSVQHLVKAWDDRSPDWEAKLERFSKTLIEQIESLSAIASAFSDFAKMPRSDMKPLNLIEAIQTSIATFSGSKIIFNFIEPQEKETLVLADKKQIIRVLNNLITNAVQAIGKNENGKISIKLEKEQQRLIVSVMDNGPGIPEDQKMKIFIPSFSTKTEGMGLGLAIVKSIIESHGGTIWFHSREGEGATFFFDLPEYNKAK